ncbi:MAG: fructosamine kinase family protein [Gammaproteobacteria bacterium]|nr:fructosamine kinase family protein [Gammaproteobacteria bacterium]
MNRHHTILESIQHGLSGALGDVADVQWVRGLAGGDINQAALIRSGGTKFFVKYHEHAPGDMFSTEARALAEILEQGVIGVPSPLAQGNAGGISWLVLEHLELTTMGPSSLMGEQLAALHDIPQEHFGWACDNYIGTTPQINTLSHNWADFWSQCRLRPQFAMAESAGFGGRLLNRGELLLQNMDQFFRGHHPAASLLHGDLWAGNKAFTPDGQPVIFDPASYYGDREADIAMTELFGGFEPAFYAAYRTHSPLPDGYQVRRNLYNLYHMLNHLNLFGSGYLSRCENMIDRLISEIH